MREVVFRVLAERPGHLEAQAVGAAFSAGVTLPIRITAPSLEELQHEAREALIEHLGSAHGAYRVRVRRGPGPAGGLPPCGSVPLIPAAASTLGLLTQRLHLGVTLDKLADS